MVDDDKRFLEVYSEILETKGYKTTTATSGEQALELIKKHYFNIVIIDVLMPRMNGIELLERIKQKYPSIIVLILTGEGSIPGAVEAMEKGALTYMLKPVDTTELIHNIKRAEQIYILQAENISLKEKLSSKNKDLIGKSDCIEEIKKQIEIVSVSDSTVLITGESGTGKEIIANMLHNKSNRSKGAFIAVNCGALPDNLLESELFGYEKGAFTGAIERKIGRFELSNGGTIFLDEIGDTSPDLQKKLLRIIQEKRFERLGGADTIYSDFRLICATNKELPQEIAKGNFREDLYYRINIIPIHIDPVRKRREDIIILFKYFYNEFCKEINKPASYITEEGEKALIGHEWRGNVREIKNLAERLAVFSDGSHITCEKINLNITGHNQVKENLPETDYKTAEKRFQLEYISKHLEKNEWNISRTAKKIGISRKTLYSKIKELNICEKSET